MTTRDLKGILDFAPSGEIKLLVKDTNGKRHEVVAIHKEFGSFHEKRLIFEIA